MMITKPTSRIEKSIFWLILSALIFIFLQVVFLAITKNYGSEQVCQIGSRCRDLLGIFGGINGFENSVAFVFSLASAVTSVIAIYSLLKNSLFPTKLSIFGLLTIILVFTGWVISGTELTNNRIIGNFLTIVALFSATIWLGLFVFREKKDSLPPGNNWRYVAWTISSLIVIVLGLIVSITDAGRLCVGYPLCNDFNGLEPLGYVALIHRLFTALLFLITLIVLNHTWKYYRSSYLMLISVTAAFTMLIGQIVVGAEQVIRNFPLELVSLHAISATGFLVALVFALIASHYETPTALPEQKTIFNDRGRLKDFYLLNKPIIVLLLLVTTYAGMVVSLGKWPSFALTFWTMLAGALAAGGSSALNQYIDREIDLSMQRTAKRPLPSGRLMPSEALALGAAEIVISFFIYASFVNMLAAVLAMVGMIYYVFLYSLWLKHVTVQNIVIGGGAGAIPPLVGWAAATGSLNIPSFFLFALVFLWTPPHFWALALVRKNDYARAKVPMLPVVNGEKTTRVQIFIYTIQLVILTLIMPLFKLGGSVYLISAIVLGLWLLHTAWRVLTVKGNKVAHKMYRYSSMYLAFIFLALTIDSLL